MRHQLRHAAFGLVWLVFALPEASAVPIPACNATTIRSNEVNCPAPPSPCTIAKDYDITGSPTCVLDFGNQKSSATGNLTPFSNMDVYAADILLREVADGDDAPQIRFFATGDPDLPGNLGHIVTQASITSDSSSESGGGTIVLNSTKGNVTVGGLIRADGDADPENGGGDGGSVTVAALRTVTGSNHITVPSA